MNRFRFLFAGAAAFAVALIAFAAVPVMLVKEKSRIEFVGSKPGASHAGGFKEFSVSGEVDWLDLASSRWHVEIDAGSVWADAGGLANHLKNADFFDAQRYTTITFDSDRIELTSPRAAIVTGRLSMLGRVVTISAPCEITLTDAGLVVKTTFRIDRTQWGMRYGKGRIDDEAEVRAVLTFQR